MNPLKPLASPHGTTPLKPLAMAQVLTRYYLWAYIPKRVASHILYPKKGHNTVEISWGLGFISLICNIKIYLILYKNWGDHPNNIEECYLIYNKTFQAYIFFKYLEDNLTNEISY